MNKVFSMSQNSAVEKGRKIIENAKRAFIGFFGKNYEGRICSNLDYEDYVFFPVDMQNALDREDFESGFYESEFGQYITKNYSKFEAKDFRQFLIKIINGTLVAGCFSAVTRNKLQTIAILPTETSNAVYLHELLHIVSTNIVGKEGETKKCEKVGFHKGFGFCLNEVFTDYLACKVDKYMKDNDLPLLGEGNSVESTYSDYFGCLAPFIEKHYNVLLQSYFGDDLSACYETFGKNNFDKILNELDLMFKNKIVESSKLNNYLLAAEEYAKKDEEK